MAALQPGAQAALGLRRHAYGVSRCRERGERADEEPPHGALMARGGVWHRNRCQNHPKGMRILPETSAPCASNPYKGVTTRRGAGSLQGGLPNLISSPHPLLLSDLRGLGHHRVACHQTRLPNSLVHSCHHISLPNLSKPRVTPLKESRAVLTSR